MVDTGSNDKYAYGVKTRKVALSRGNRQGNSALTDDDHNYCPKENMFDQKFLQKLERSSFIHELVLTHEEFCQSLIDNFEALIETGNKEMAAFCLKVTLKSGGYGFNQYHLLALVMDIDPKAELEKERLKKEQEKMKIQDENEDDECDSENESELEIIKFEDPFLTRDEQVNLLMKIRKANIIKKATYNQNITPMHCACINPDTRAMEFFIEKAEDLHVYDLNLRKPVHYAACSPSTANLQVLKRLGVDLRDSDKIYKTPLMYACEYGRLENVKYIVENTTSNLDSKCRTGSGPIHFAAENGHFGRYHQSNDQKPSSISTSRGRI